MDNDQVLKVTGYFVYYRFINLAIVTPDAYNVVDKELEPLGKQHYPPPPISQIALMFGFVCFFKGIYKYIYILTLTPTSILKKKK